MLRCRASRLLAIWNRAINSCARIREEKRKTNQPMSNEPRSQNDVDTLARELLSAYETGQMIDVPPSARPGFDLNAAYDVEAKLKQFREAAGHRAVGRKVGYAKKAMWRALKLETLVWAHLYDHTVHFSDTNSATLTVEHARSLKIEPEIVFGVSQQIAGESAAAASALRSTDWLALGFEIIDCPFPQWKFQPSDFVASLWTSHGTRDRREDTCATGAHPHSGGRARAIQSAHSQKRRVCRRGIGQKFSEQPRAMPRGT